MTARLCRRFGQRKWQTACSSASAGIERFIATLEARPITVDRPAPDVTWGPVLALARQQGLSVYDASYLELAARSGVALATRDERMGAAAARMGVDLA